MIAGLLGLLVFIGLFITAASSTGDPSGQACAVAGRASSAVPANYVPWLAQAASRYKLGPRGFAILAAVHYVESDFARSPLPGVAPGTKNSAGAMGPGQFLAESWTSFGVDADRDGVKDPYSVPDSVFATANLLHASGAPGDWHAALFTYNHAEWYVEEVLEAAERFGAAVLCQPAPSGAGAEKVESVARWIESRRLHYCWGGGHAAEPGPSGGEYCWSAEGVQVFGAAEDGLDCSGAVRWLLVLSGFEDPGPIGSGGFSGVYPAGPGESVTIWSNVDHVFVTINGRDWGTSETNFAHGPGFAVHSKAGFLASHPLPPGGIDGGA